MKIVNSFDELIKAIGLKPGDTIEITGSQHYRDYELEINFIPQNKEELQAIIATASQEDLQKMGVCIWTTYESHQKEKKGSALWDGEPLKKGEVHFLFPSEWYDFIPAGFPIVDIFGVKAKFEHGSTDNDMRFGCLSFGFIRKELEAKEIRDVRDIPFTGETVDIPNQQP